MSNKNFLLLLVFSFLCLNCWAQKEDELGKVATRLGYEMYILSEPIREYEELFTVNITSYEINAPETGKVKITRKLAKKRWSIAQKVSLMAEFVKAKDKDNAADAIIYSAGQTASAIKFTSDVSSEITGKGKVRTELGVALFVLCEPDDKIKTKSKWSTMEFNNKKIKLLESLFTAQSSIEEDVYKIYNKLTEDERQKKWPDGIIFSASGKVLGFKLQ